MVTDLQRYKKLRNEFMSFRFGFGSPKAKTLVSLERKLKKRGLVDVNGMVVR